MYVLDEREFVDSGLATEDAGAVTLAHEVTSNWTARLEMGPADRHFLDHPLDHVPGMALVTGLLDLLRAGGGGFLERDDRRIAMSFDFPSFCETGEPVELHAAGTPAGPVALAARQGERIVCGGQATLSPARPAARSRPVWRPEFDRPAEKALVHRHRAENVLVSSMAVLDGARVAAVRRPAADHFLARQSGAPMRIETLIDAARQFVCMVFHGEHGKPFGTRFVLLGIELDLHCDLSSASLLRWSWTPPPRGRFRTEFDLLDGSLDGEPCGRISIEAMAMSRAGYERLRGPAVTR